MEEQTFSKSLIEWQGFAERLLNFVAVEKQFVDEGLVIALSSKFGSGKSTFLAMLENFITSNQVVGNPLVINLNAWESDYYGDPLYGIISSIVEKIKSEGKSPHAIVEAAKDVLWLGADVAAQISKAVSGVDLIASKESAERRRLLRSERVPISNDAFSIFQRRKEAMGKLKTEVSHFIDRSNGYVLFLVDELDRCRPDYAISYLETVKHMFDIRGAVFILAADRQQLEVSAKTAFGEKLDFEEYLRKFVHREVSLPSPERDDYNRISQHYVGQFFSLEGVRFPRGIISDSVLVKSTDLVQSLRLTPRQAKEMFRIVGHLQGADQETKGEAPWMMMVVTFAMAAFRVSNQEIFDKIGSSSYNFQEVYNCFVDIRISDPVWWFSVFAFSGSIKISRDLKLSVIYKKLGIAQDDDDFRENFAMRFGQDHRGRMGIAQNVFQRIAILEEWS